MDGRAKMDGMKVDVQGTLEDRPLSSEMTVQFSPSGPPTFADRSLLALLDRPLSDLRTVHFDLRPSTLDLTRISDHKSHEVVNYSLILTVRCCTVRIFLNLESSSST